MELTNEMLCEFRAIAIFGNTGSGKTAYCYKLLSQFKEAGKDVYFIKHPKPELLSQFGYNNLNGLEDVARLSGCVIYWDEPQLYNDVPEYKRDLMIAKILSLARQRDITFIISSSDTRTFTKRVEAYFDMWCVKDCEYSMTKQRSMLRNIMLRNSVITPEELNLAKNEVIVYNRKFVGINGLHTFSLIPQWCEALSKPYNISCASQKIEITLTTNKLNNPVVSCGKAEIIDL